MKGLTKYWAGLLLMGIAFTSCETDVYDPLPQADFSVVNDTIMAPAEVLFTNNSELADYYEWDFGDGTQSTEESPIHAYSQKGNYIVTLRAIGESGETKISKTIVVESAYEYVIYNTSPYTLYNLKSFETENETMVNLIEHGTLASGQKSSIILTKGEKVSVSFENGQGYLLTVIFPFDVEKGKLNFLEVKKYTMVYIEKLEDDSSSKNKKTATSQRELVELF